MSHTNKTAATKILAIAVTALMLIGIFTATAAAAAAGPGTYKVTTPSGLYVRAGAGTNHSIVGGISYGATFTVSQTSGNWGYVPSHGGWSCLDYAQLIQSSGTTTSANIADGVYYIYFANSNYVVDIERANPGNGAKTILYSPNYGANQQFRFTRQSDGTYRITPMHSQGKCVEVRNSSKSDGAEVGIWDYVGIDCQKWYIVEKNGYYNIVNKNSGKYLDVDDGRAQDWTRVHQWGGGGGWTEQFRLVPVQTNTTTITGAEGAIRWAEEQLGSRRYDGMCLKFVSDAYNRQGVLLGSYGDAKSCANGKTRYGNFDAPRGALVFFDYIAKDGRNLGHVGISLGNGSFIHATTGKGVIISVLRGYDDSRYLGWAYPAK